MKKTEYDVIIVGGGPSGLNTARKLAAAGIRTAVLERKSGIGENVICTGIIGKEAFPQFDLSPDSVIAELKNVDLISPFDSKLTYSHPESFAYVVDRLSFDLNLACEAEKLGARIRCGTAVKSVKIDPEGVFVKAVGKSGQTEIFKSSVLVLATGIDYNLHKQLGLGIPSHFINGVQAEIQVDSSSLPAILVGKDIAPGAFAWIVPISTSTARVGLVTEKDPSFYFHQLMRRYYPYITLRENIIRYKAIAQSPLDKTYSDRLLVVGEAAGQVKTTTGGGVFYGLVCSDIAARIILEAIEKQNFGHNFLSQYELLWKKAIQRELTVGFFTRKVCGKLRDGEVEKLFQLARNNGVFPLIQSIGRFDWQGDLLIELAKKATIRSLNSLPGLIGIKSKESRPQKEFSL